MNKKQFLLAGFLFCGLMQQAVFGSDTLEIQLQQAKLGQQVDKDNHAAHQLAVIDSQWRSWEKQLNDSRSQKLDGVVSCVTTEVQDAIVAALAALARVEVERAKQEEQKLKQNQKKADFQDHFYKCLIAHKNSSDITAYGIPSVCEYHALALELLGEGSKVDAMTAGFKKIMKK
jgi:hypothetical protein